MGILVGALTSLVAGLVAYEMSARVPKLSRWLIEVSVRQLPPEEQDRYREEWLAHYHDMPNSMARLSHAFTLLITGAAREIAGDLVEQKMSTIEAGLSELTRNAMQHREQVRKLDQRIFELDREDRIGTAARKSLSEIDETLKNSGLSMEVTAPIRNSAERYIITIQSAASRSREVLKLRADSLRQKTEDIADELALAAAAYDRAKRIRKSMRKAGLGRALAEVLFHLEEAKNTQTPSPGYEALVEESARLSEALKQVGKPDFAAPANIPNSRP